VFIAWEMPTLDRLAREGGKVVKEYNVENERKTKQSRYGRTPGRDRKKTR